MARAAINILGATGEKYDLVTQGDTEITSARVSKGVYEVYGTLGMVPFPPIDVGWGYSINNVDRKADVELSFDGSVLTATVTKNDQPYDLIHLLTLHILVPDPKVQPVPISIANSEEEPQEQV